MTDVAKLHEMQKIDSNWEKIRKRLLQLQSQTAEPEELRAARAAQSETEREIHTWNARQRDAELEGQSLAQRIKDGESRLMGGSVRNPKELDSLQHSIDALRRQRDAVEESAVEALLMNEELGKRSAREAADLSQREAQWSHRHQDLLQEEARLKRMALQLKAQRSALVAALPAEDVELYEDLRKRRAGVAIASIVNGQCSACNVRVPTGVNSTAKSGGIAYCTSCGRLLVA